MTLQLADRIERYKAIEQYRQRPLIVYATSTRPNMGAMMAADAVREIIDQMDTLSSQEEVDILLHSTGGDPLAAWKMMSVLRERFKRVCVLVPYMAFSAATLFALGADEIVMHPHASLGPIDPQVSMPTPDGARRAFSYEDVGAFLRFLTDEVRISEQVHVSTIIDKLFSVVDPLVVGGAKRASELSSQVGERLLLMHMTASEDKARARGIAENLNKSFFAHADAVSRSRARKLDLSIAADDPQLERLIWEAYLGLESYLDLRTPFSPVQLFLSDPKAAQSLRPIAPLTFPPNTPPPLLQQGWNAAMDQAIQRAFSGGVEVDFSVTGAVIESARAASHSMSEGRLSGVRTPAGEVQIAAVEIRSGWRRVSHPADTPPASSPAQS